MGNSKNSPSSGKLEDCEMPGKHSATENLASRTKRKLLEIKYQRMTGNPQAVARYRFAMIFGFTSLIVALILVGSMVYSSFQTGNSPNSMYSIQIIGTGQCLVFGEFEA